MTTLAPTSPEFGTPSISTTAIWSGRVLSGLLVLFLLFDGAILYAIPRTSMLGAILLTGYLGGAIYVHVRADSPLFSHTLFGVYLGVIMWAGLWLRDPAIRTLIPFQR